jgi:hypothetical protein
LELDLKELESHKNEAKKLNWEREKAILFLIILVLVNSSNNSDNNVLLEYS